MLHLKFISLMSLRLARQTTKKKQQENWPNFSTKQDPLHSSIVLIWPHLHTLSGDNERLRSWTELKFSRPKSLLHTTVSQHHSLLKFKLKSKLKSTTTRRPKYWLSKTSMTSNLTLRRFYRTPSRKILERNKRLRTKESKQNTKLNLLELLLKTRESSKHFKLRETESLLKTWENSRHTKQNWTESLQKILESKEKRSIKRKFSDNKENIKRSFKDKPLLPKQLLIKPNFKDRQQHMRLHLQLQLQIVDLTKKKNQIVWCQSIHY